MNVPYIYVFCPFFLDLSDDYTAEEQEQMAEEKRKKQEQLRAQRVKAKKVKRKGK